MVPLVLGDGVAGVRHWTNERVNSAAPPDAIETHAARELQDRRLETHAAR
ncbi:hypothetical protein ACQEVF_06260 [Nonomuraea polychroma]